MPAVTGSQTSPLSCLAEGPLTHPYLLLLSQSNLVLGYDLSFSTVKNIIKYVVIHKSLSCCRCWL